MDGMQSMREREELDVIPRIGNWKDGAHRRRMRFGGIIRTPGWGTQGQYAL